MIHLATLIVLAVPINLIRGSAVEAANSEFHISKLWFGKVSSNKLRTIDSADRTSLADLEFTKQLAITVLFFTRRSFERFVFALDSIGIMRIFNSLKKQTFCVNKLKEASLEYTNKCEMP